MLWAAGGSFRPGNSFSRWHGRGFSFSVPVQRRSSGSTVCPWTLTQKAPKSSQGLFWVLNVNVKLYWSPMGDSVFICRPGGKSKGQPRLQNGARGAANASWCCWRTLQGAECTRLTRRPQPKTASLTHKFCATQSGECAGFHLTHI